MKNLLLGTADIMASSLAKYAEMQKPQKLFRLIDDQPKDEIKTSLIEPLFWRENAGEGLFFSCLDTECHFNSKLNANTWSYDYEKNILEFSRDLWEKRDKEESNYQLHGALAAVLAFKLFKSVDRNFHWKLCFYALGFNPQRDNEERKKIEAIARKTINVSALKIR